MRFQPTSPRLQSSEGLSGEFHSQYDSLVGLSAGTSVLHHTGLSLGLPEFLMAG